ncbi:MAG: 4-hydroxy-tetrahydrodipicolinate synthase [Patescibacteria group bacterium]|nr:4-hydroxy-tetrahydrodipicolinate synthase [Patescibacteria group bacterium]
MSTKKLGGVLTALVTPFDGKGGVDREALRRLIDFQLKQGVDGLVPTGTTGESPTLTWPEQLQVIQLTRQSAGNTFVLAGTGSNSTKEALDHSRKAVELGVDGVLSLDAYYNKPASWQLLALHHLPIATAVHQVAPGIRYVPYIIPGRTGCQLLPPDLAKLAEYSPNVTAVKEATGNLENMVLTRQLLGLDFLVLSGDDSLTAAMMTSMMIRANGVISVMSNLIPGIMVKMIRLLSGANVLAGGILAKTLEPLFSCVGIAAPRSFDVNGQSYTVTDKFPNPCAVKTMMAGLGMCSIHMRQPLGLMTPAAVLICRDTLRQLWQTLPEALTPINDHFGVDVEARLHDNAIWKSLGANI